MAEIANRLPWKAMVPQPAIPLEDALRLRVLLLNAAPQNPAWHRLPGSAWGGTQFEGSPNLNLTHPDLVTEWNIQMLDAGADALETLSFGAEPFTSECYGADRALRREWNRSAVALARQASGGEKYTLGAVGTSEALAVLPRHTFEEQIEAFTEQIRDLLTAGVDAIHLVFQFDSLTLRAALHAVDAVQQELGGRIPAMITFDLNRDGTIISGERPEALWEWLRPHRPIALGLATYGWGLDTLRRLRNTTDVPLGLLLDPFPWAPPSMTENRPIEWLGECLRPPLEEGLLNFCGLSCTVPSIEYIRAIAQLIGK
jgi:5-methyltetrahydrofolate--homocysteine methyltransferase